MTHETSMTRQSDASSLVFGRIADALEHVERAMREQLTSYAEMVDPMGDHVLASGGKRMRPALVLLAAELCGYTGPRRIQIAAALEMVHTATLLHDDVVDLADLRRGRPSANAVWGNRRAVLVGDFFYSRASSMIVEDGDLGILEVFSSTIRALAEGELLQLQRSFDLSVTEAQYYEIIDRKSATLLSAACESGAMLSGVTRPERRRVAQFGRELGLAFQQKDDALDYSTDSATLGKGRYADLREGKITLPLLLTLKRCSSNERNEIGSVLKEVSRISVELASEGRDAIDAPELDGLVASVVELVARHRGVTDTLRRANEHVTLATESIAAFPDNPAKQALLGAAAFAVSRES